MAAKRVRQTESAQDEVFCKRCQAENMIEGCLAARSANDASLLINGCRKMLRQIATTPLILHLWTPYVAIRGREGCSCRK